MRCNIGTALCACTKHTTNKAIPNEAHLYLYVVIEELISMLTVSWSDYYSLFIDFERKLQYVAVLK